MIKYIDSINSEYVEDLFCQIKESIYCGLDVETNSLDPYSAIWILLQLSFEKDVYVINVPSVGIELVRSVVESIKNNNVTCIGHNIKFDWTIIHHNTGIKIDKVYDTQIGEILSDRDLKDRYPSLAYITNKYFGVNLDKEVRNEFINYSGIITDQQIVYSANDVKYLFGIMQKQLDNINILGQMKVCELEMNLVPVFAYMEYTGVLINQDLWKENLKVQTNHAKESADKFFTYLRENIDFGRFENAYELNEFFRVLSKSNMSIKKINLLKSMSPEFAMEWFFTNFNMNSNVQMLALLKDYFKVPVTDTNEKNLKDYANDFEVIKLLLNYRDAEKKLSTYGENFLGKINPKTNRIHASFNQLGTATGRVSSNNPKQSWGF